MTVGTAAKRAGVNIDTMRYHERQGLLPKPPRTAGGYRALTEAAVDGLRFVKQAQALGLTLNDCSYRIDGCAGGTVWLELTGAAAQEFIRELIRKNTA